MNKICLNIEFDFSGFKINHKIKEQLEASNEFHADLILSDEELLLKIHIDPKSQFDSQLALWIHKDHPNNNFGRTIKVVKVDTPERVDNVLFTNSKVIWYNLGSSNFENGQRFFPIKFQSVRIDYKSSFPKKRKNFKSLIYLENNATTLINEYYTINPFYREKNIWEAKNNQQEFKTIGEIDYLLEFSHITKKDENGFDTIIKRIPRIEIKHQNLNPDKFKFYQELVISLMSLYTGLNILPYQSSHFTKEKTVVETWINSVDSNKHSNFVLFETGLRFYDLIDSININIIKDTIHLNEVVMMFNLARKTSGSTKFLLLFSIIERLRKYILGGKKIKEKFDFTLKSKEINQLIKSKLSEVINYIVPEQHVIFNRMLNNKVENIKYLPQSHQFDSLFKLAKLDPGEFSLSFSEILKLRSQIIHGKIVGEDQLKIVNKNFLRFTLHCILYYLGKE